MLLKHLKLTDITLNISDLKRNINKPNVFKKFGPTI